MRLNDLIESNPNIRDMEYYYISVHHTCKNKFLNVLQKISEDSGVLVGRRISHISTTYSGIQQFLVRCTNEEITLIKLSVNIQVQKRPIKS